MVDIEKATKALEKLRAVGGDPDTIRKLALRIQKAKVEANLIKPAFMEPEKQKPAKTIEQQKTMAEEAYKKSKSPGGEDDPILKVLSDKPKEKFFLDIGWSEEHNLIWYGFINANGEMAIILSDGRVLQNTLHKEEIIVIDDKTKKKERRSEYAGKNEIGELFDYSVELGDIAPSISRAAITAFYKAKIAGKRNLVSLPKLYTNIKDKLEYYLDFGPESKSSDVLTCWILCTYIFPIFYWFPHILFNGPMGSGKTKLLHVTLALSFRGYEIGSSGGLSGSNIYRTLEGNRGTIGFDEFENADEESQRLIHQILNAAASRDAFIIRNEQIFGGGRKYKPTKFPLFCPKIAANISGINPTSLSRFISIQLVKTETTKGNRHPYAKKDKLELELIQDQCYLFGLEHWQDVKKIYDSYVVPVDIKNRDADNWKPLLAIAKLIDSETNNTDITDALLKFFSEYDIGAFTTDDLPEAVIRGCLEHVKETKAIDNWYQVQAIVNNTLSDILCDQKHPTAAVGRILKNYKFKSKRQGKGILYFLTEDNLSKIIRLYWPEKKDENPPKHEPEGLSVVSVVSVGCVGKNCIDKTTKTDIATDPHTPNDPTLHTLHTLHTHTTQTTPKPNGAILRENREINNLENEGWVKTKLTMIDCTNCHETMCCTWSYNGLPYCQKCYDKLVGGQK